MVSVTDSDDKVSDAVAFYCDRCQAPLAKWSGFAYGSKFFLRALCSFVYLGDWAARCKECDEEETAARQKLMAQRLSDLVVENAELRTLLPKRATVEVRDLVAYSAWWVLSVLLVLRLAMIQVSNVIASIFLIALIVLSAVLWWMVGIRVWNAVKRKWP